VSWREWSSHRKRWATGLLVGLPLLGVLTLGPLWMWLLLVVAAAGAGLWELEGLLFPRRLSPSWRGLYMAGGLFLPAGAFGGGLSGLQVALTGSFFLLLAACLWDFEKLREDGMGRLARFALAWLYIPYLLSYALLVGALHQGRAWMVFVLVVIVASDSGAFYCGRRWGRRKLYPAVSPNKTVEGSAGGALAALAAGSVFALLFLDGVSAGAVVVLSLLLTLVGQTGDLAESMMKRLAKAKDSGGLLPGHGGMLDRLDSLLFAFPAVWFFPGVTS